MDTKTRSSPSASPEFEFWMVRNPAFPQPNILSADQLIANGVLLPLHLVNKPQPSPSPSPSPSITDSKRWKDLFRKKNDDKGKNKDKDKKALGASAELNINLWPFSRSSSAGTRPKMGAPATRKANSAPCSRSNSAGDSKSRKWPGSPARPGVHLGRSSPVWQVRRPKNPEPDKPKRRTTVPMCIAYKHHFTCRTHDSTHNPVPAGKLFSLRTLFSKKTLVT